MQTAGNTSGILNVFQRTAGMILRDPDVLIGVELHCTADTVLAFFLKQIGGDRRIHASLIATNSFLPIAYHPW